MAGATLAACSSVPGTEEDTGTEHLGEATIAASPQSTAQPAGTLIDTPNHAPAPVLIGLEDGTVVLQQDSTLTIGTPEQLQNSEFRTLDSAADCGEVSARNSTIVLPCPHPISEGDGAGGTVYLIDPYQPELSTFKTTDIPVTAAALTDDGAVVAGASTTNKVAVFPADGDEVSSFVVDKQTDQIIAVPRADKTDAVALINKDNTSIHQVLWEENKNGAALRAGTGVGRIAASDNDVVVASDTRDGQLLVYTMDPVIRLHQSIPVDPSPYAVAWDAHHSVAWIASTENNTLTAYDIATGVPEKKASLATIGDVRSLIIQPDGSLLVGSATDSRLQLISAAEITQALGA